MEVKKYYCNSVVDYCFIVPDGDKGNIKELETIYLRTGERRLAQIPRGYKLTKDCLNIHGSKFDLKKECIKCCLKEERKW